MINGRIDHPQTHETLYNVLVVAAINPTSGFFILVPRSEVVHLNISIEEAMRWIVSGGIISPKNLGYIDSVAEYDKKHTSQAAEH